jgi:hypothetical protein
MLAPLDLRLIERHPLDIAHFLIAAKALAAGQQLHADQLTAIGGAFMLPLAWAYNLLGSGALALNSAYAAAAPVICCLCIAVSYRRLSPFSAAVMTAFAVLSTLQPFNLGDDFHALSVAMQYNKIGFALLLILFVVLAIPRSSRRGGRSALDVALIVIILTLCFYLKVTYFVVGATAAVLIAASIPALLGDRIRVVVAVALASTIIAVVPGSDNYIRDIMFSGLESDNAILGPYAYVTMIRENADIVMLSIATAGLTVVLRPDRLREAVVFGVVFLGGSFAALSQNAQAHMMPSAAAFTIVLSEWLRQKQSAGPSSPGAGPASTLRLQLIRLAAGLVLVLYPGLLATQAALGLSYYRSTVADDERIHTATFSSAVNGVTFRRSSTEHGWESLKVARLSRQAGLTARDPFLNAPGAWFTAVANADALVRQVGLRPGTVFTVDTINSAALIDGMMPAAPWHLWVQEGFQPVSEDVLASVDHVFLPVRWGQPKIQERVWNIYGDKIEANFVEAARSDMWVICTRRGKEADQDTSRSSCKRPKLR